MINFKKIPVFSVRDSLLILTLVGLIPAVIIHFYTLTQNPHIVDFEGTLRRNIIGLSVITILSLSLAWLVGNALILRRIKHLLTAIDKLRSGDLSAQISAPVGTDELGQLTKAFNQMTLTLAQKQKMVEKLDQMKSDFFWMTAHQLRTPLSHIRWNLELLLREEDSRLSPTQKVKIMKLQTFNEETIRLIQEVLNISKQNRYQFENAVADIDLPDMIKKIVSELEPEVKAKKVKIGLDFPKEGEVKIRAGQLHFYEALHNLISNAIKYNHDSGEVTVKVSGDNEMITIVVADTGIGIPKDQQSKIFSRFFRASNVRGSEGTGLGLALVKTYIDELGGSIDFKSEENKGTKFTIKIPCDTLRA